MGRTCLAGMASGGQSKAGTARPGPLRPGGLDRVHWIGVRGTKPDITARRSFVSQAPRAAYDRTVCYVYLRQIRAQRPDLCCARKCRADDCDGGRCSLATAINGLLVRPTSTRTRTARWMCAPGETAVRGSAHSHVNPRPVRARGGHYVCRDSARRYP